MLFFFFFPILFNQIFMIKEYGYHIWVLFYLAYVAVASSSFM